MICSNPNCKSNIPDDSKFCPDCGTSVKNEEEIRAKAKDIVSKYEKGACFFMAEGILPFLTCDLIVEDYEKIIRYKNKIIQKHKEIVMNEKKLREQQERCFASLLAPNSLSVYKNTIFK